jgi:hypothetical protein
VNFRIRKHIAPTHIWVCNGCGLWHTTKPAQCLDRNCGRMDFEHFGSKAEAERWAQLLLQHKLGKIRKLRRQTRFDLLAYGAHGQPIKIGVYVDDFDYERVDDGVFVIEDVKGVRRGQAVVDTTAGLKLKWMEAMGLPVTIVKL